MNLENYCKRNVVSETWFIEYTKLKEFMESVVNKGEFSNKNYMVFEKNISKLPALFDEIKIDVGLNDKFKEFAKEQAWNIGSLYNFTLKHSIDGKGEIFASLFEDTLKILIDNEKELDSIE